MKEFRQSVKLLLVHGSGDNRQLLLRQRGPAKHGAGTVALPGGHIEYAEDANRLETIREASVREAREELGDAIADTIAVAFDKDLARIAACVDDVQENGVQYRHIAVQIPIANDVEPDLNAVDHDEHTDLHWRPVTEVARLLQEDKIYPQHRTQVLSFVREAALYTDMSER